MLRSKSNIFFRHQLDGYLRDLSADKSVVEGELCELHPPGMATTLSEVDVEPEETRRRVSESMAMLDARIDTQKRKRSRLAEEEESRHPGKATGNVSNPSEFWRYVLVTSAVWGCLLYLTRRRAAPGRRNIKARSRGGGGGEAT